MADEDNGTPLFWREDDLKEPPKLPFYRRWFCEHEYRPRLKQSIMHLGWYEFFCAKCGRIVRGTRDGP